MTMGLVRPRVVVSKCLGFESCKYDGGMNDSTAVDGLRPRVDFLPICPEVEIGLGVPRSPIDLVSSKPLPRLMDQESGEDFTDRMTSFADSFLGSIEEVDGFILKSASPSCALRDAKIYTKQGRVIALGPGLFGNAVLKRFSHSALADEKELKYHSKRRRFLDRLFSLAESREHGVNASPR